MSEETNKRVGDYQILNELGSGGMGRVYRVRNVLSDRIDAMKVLLPDLTGQQELAARFLREIKLMASLDHPNIAALRTAFTADNQLVMIMEYVEGDTVAARLEHGPIPLSDALNWIGQVLSALSYAHQQNVIHRDIKPVNMMLTPQGVIKLMDFGIARGGADRSLTMSGTTLGSLSYMSPEQVKGEATDARSDLYSVGISLYEMVTGQRPFQAHSDYSIMAAHVKEMPKPPIELQPGLPAALNEIILMAIAKDPARRFQTADAFRNALSSVQTTAATSAAAVRSASETPTVDIVTPPAAWQTAPAVTPPVAVLKDSKAAAPSAPLPVPPPPRSSSHRGLYMTLGALIVLAVLVAAGVYLPRRSTTQATTSVAGSQSTGQPSQPAPDTATPSGDAMQPPAEAPAPADNSGSPQPPVSLAATREAEKPAPHSLLQKNAGDGAAMPAQEETAAGAQGAADNEAELDKVEREVDQLSTRAAAVQNSLERMQQQQASSGWGLRSDMVAKMASVQTNLSKAQQAVQHGDVARARKYSKLAEGDVEALERFLGR
jgi:serine/threonine-protein kinase